VKSSSKNDFLSVEAQEKLIGEYSSRKKVLIAEWFRDRDTQGEMLLANREFGAKLLGKVKRGDSIVCASPGRMFGRASDASENMSKWVAMGVEIHFVSLGSSLGGKSLDLLLSFLDSLGEEETRLVGERISRTKKVLAGEGKFPGGRIPFGFKESDDGKITINPDHRDALAFILLNSSQGLSNRWISRELEKRFGIKLSYNGVKRAVERSKDDTELWKLLNIVREM
jgi:DNA invertase Pin-like site-specific DNA recombinase